jgi:hypothetical protein
MRNLDNLYAGVCALLDVQIREAQLWEAKCSIAGLVESFLKGDVEACYIVANA